MVNLVLHFFALAAFTLRCAAPGCDVRTHAYTHARGKNRKNLKKDHKKKKKKMGGCNSLSPKFMILLLTLVVMATTLAQAAEPVDVVEKIRRSVEVR